MWGREGNGVGELKQDIARKRMLERIGVERYLLQSWIQNSTTFSMIPCTKYIYSSRDHFPFHIIQCSNPTFRTWTDGHMHTHANTSSISKKGSDDKTTTNEPLSPLLQTLGPSWVSSPGWLWTVPLVKHNKLICWGFRTKHKFSRSGFWASISPTTAVTRDNHSPWHSKRRAQVN